MNLRNLRKQQNLTQKDVAKIIQVAPTTYLGYEKGTSEPNIETLKKLADFYEVSVDQLIGRPRPYDLPSTATQEQKNVIKTILQLNAINTLKAQAYCLGLLANQ